VTDAPLTDTRSTGAAAGLAGVGDARSPRAGSSGPWRSLLEPRFLAWAALGTVGSLLAFGVVSAIIPNPVFGREIPPEPFAIVVWLASAPLMGVILATYVVPPPAVGVALGAGPSVAPGASVAAAAAGPPAGPSPAPGSTNPVASSPAADPVEDRRSLLGYAGGFAAFLAIGCPVCNKIILVALGTTGALTIWAPLQPLIGAASLVLLAGTLAWRLRVRARGGACSVA
jgi:hypothetical protein